MFVCVCVWLVWGEGVGGGFTGKSSTEIQAGVSALRSYVSAQTTNTFIQTNSRGFRSFFFCSGRINFFLFGEKKKSLCCSAARQDRSSSPLQTSPPLTQHSPHPPSVCLSLPADATALAAALHLSCDSKTYQVLISTISYAPPPTSPQHPHPPPPPPQPPSLLSPSDLILSSPFSLPVTHSQVLS